MLVKKEFNETNENFKNISSVLNNKKNAIARLVEINKVKNIEGTLDSIWEFQIIDQGIGMSMVDLGYMQTMAGSSKNIHKKKIINENTAEIPCAINVARAAPNTPSPKPATIQRSIRIFKTEENIRSTNGIFDSPIEVNIVERILYINKNGNPTK